MSQVHSPAICHLIMQPMVQAMLHQGRRLELELGLGFGSGMALGLICAGL